MLKWLDFRKMFYATINDLERFHDRIANVPVSILENAARIST